MDALNVFILVWTISGCFAWSIAKRRNGSGALWAVIGQIFGPLAIPFAFMVDAKI